MKKVVRENPYFFLISLLFLSIGAVFVFMTEKGDTTRYFNNHNSLLLDHFFKYYTYIGTSFFVVPLCVLLYIKQQRYLSFVLFSSYLFSGVLVQLLKRVVIQDNFRPLMYFFHQPFHEVSGVDVHGSFSFPSGHTNSAFVLFLTLSFFSSKKWGGLFAVLAILVAISRMYLYQHFLIDTLGGAGIAIIFTTLIYWYCEKINIKEKSFLKH